MPRTAQRAALLLGILLLASGCARLGWLRTDRPRLRPAEPQVGKPAPDFDAEDFDGRRVKLSEQRGKVVALIFWRTQCPPCRAMIPHEREMVERLRGKPFTLISVNNDVDLPAARKVIVDEQMTWPQVKASDVLMRGYRVTSLPAIFVIDQNGVLRATHLRGPDLENTINALLSEPTTTSRDR